jgi:hypothetical protein
LSMSRIAEEHRENANRDECKPTHQERRE